LEFNTSNVRKMKKFFLLILLIVPVFGYSQTRTLKGRIYTDIGHGCFVISEPSGIRSRFEYGLEGSSMIFTIDCPVSDTALICIFPNKKIKYKIDTNNNGSEINIDFLYYNKACQIPYQQNEFQIIINDFELPLYYVFSYMIDNHEIKLSSNIENDSLINLDNHHYLIDDKTAIEIIKNLAAITKHVKQKDYEGNYYDGQELEIKIIFKGHYYSYMIHMVYLKKISRLLETINNVIRVEDKIEYYY
jgi:hypothetical protein